jgi:hypothetical protein
MADFISSNGGAADASLILTIYVPGRKKRRLVNG